MNIRRGPAVKKALAQLFIFPAGVSVYRALGSPFRHREGKMCTPHCCVCAARGERGGALTARSRGAIRRGKKQKVKQSQIFGAKYRAFGLAPKKETAAKGIKARLSLGRGRERRLHSRQRRADLPAALFFSLSLIYARLPSLARRGIIIFQLQNRRAGVLKGLWLKTRRAARPTVASATRTHLQPLFTNVKYHKRGSWSWL